MTLQKNLTHLSTARQSGFSRIALLIILAVVLAVAAYFLLFPISDPPIEPSVQVPPAAKQARPDSAREVINTLRAADEVDYDSAYDQANAFLDDGDVADAQLLYFFAARQGHGPSALVLARLYDPLDFDPSTSLMDEPDPFQAFKWYRQALESGEEEAAPRLEALRAWAAEAAAAGDQQAEQLLLQWEKSS